MRVALIRHGQTDWNLAGRMQGRTDVPLNETGRREARRLAERLAHDETWDAVVTSPLRRARETAEILAELLSLTATVCDGLVERSFGDAEGLSHSDALEQWPSRHYPSMEGHVEVAERGVIALDRVAERFPGGRVIAVTHGSFIRHVLADISGVSSDQVPRAENLAISEIERDASERWHVRSISGRGFAPESSPPHA